MQFRWKKEETPYGPHWHLEGTDSPYCHVVCGTNGYFIFYGPDQPEVLNKDNPPEKVLTRAVSLVRLHILSQLTALEAIQ